MNQQTRDQLFSIKKKKVLKLFTELKKLDMQQAVFLKGGSDKVPCNVTLPLF